MNLLISGGSGFLGGAFSEAIIKRYRSESQEVHITWLTRDSNQPHPIDIKMTYDELTKSNQSFDVMLNLAGAGCR